MAKYALLTYLSTWPGPLHSRHYTSGNTLHNITTCTEDIGTLFTRILQICMSLKKVYEHCSCFTTQL